MYEVEEVEQLVQTGEIFSEQFTITRLLNNANSQVYAAKDKQNQPCVVKISEKSNTNGYRQLQNEETLLRGPLKDCPGVPKLIHVGQTLGKTDRLFLVETPVGITSHARVGCISEKDIAPLLKTWAAQLVETLQQVHKRGVLHLDVKPENVIMADEKAILIDFGFSQLKHQAEPCEYGTKTFASRNVLNGRIPSEKDDFESLCYTIHAIHSPGEYRHGRQTFASVLSHSPAARWIAQETGLN